MRVLPAHVSLALSLAACGGKSPATTTPRADPSPPVDGAASGAASEPAKTPDAPTGPGGEAPKPGDAPLDKAACAKRPDMFGPVLIDEAQAQRRYGQNARTFADAPTTKDRTIEVCGIPASRQWLRGTVCADGSSARQNGRVGSVGPGGRCGSIIDLYTVTCPEGDLEVFIDIYMCGPGESMR
ncbi:MAG TPA: hypothetical protein VNO30_37390 [Kofleriaceae bacterium]|nr:hypothetical protein [Kofleriaceae bacterium]